MKAPNKIKFHGATYVLAAASTDQVPASILANSKKAMALSKIAFQKSQKAFNKNDPALHKEAIKYIQQALTAHEKVSRPATEAGLEKIRLRHDKEWAKLYHELKKHWKATIDT